VATAGSPEPDPTPKRAVQPALTGDAAWQAARRAVADRNAQARKIGKKQRQEHEGRIANLRRAASDPDGPPQPTA
jgi:hypothetical protein